MPRKPSPPSWPQVAEKIVRESMSMLHAARSCEIDLPAEELERTYQSKEFQTVLWKARLDYYSEIANQPGRTKAAALGLMTLALQNLAAEGEWEKVVEGVLKLAKVEGWVGGESNVNVFANVTAKDIEEAKKKLQELVKSPNDPRIPKPVLPN